MHPAATQDPLTRARRQMVAEQIAKRDVRDTATLRAMLAVPRHEFVPAELRANAYADFPLPIGHGQTISQPYIVAFMTAQLRLTPRSRVLEVGTGSGYQAAVLAEIAGEVYTIEILPPLAQEAAARLQRLGYGRVHVRTGDGYNGWPEAAPFDAVIVTAAAGFVPPPLVEQLRPGGRMVIPVGEVGGVQELMLIEKAADGRTTTRTLIPVRFVPLTGRH
ncbi:MAG: protein-L-isoaspartate(D-aspartate) O-methyltransferase [Gemmatimonadota bacterium]